MNRIAWQGHSLVTALLTVLLTLVVPRPAVAQQPAIGSTFRDCANCPEMVVLPPGTFVMGSPAGEVRRHDYEKQHPVKIPRAFAIGKFDVTVEEFKQFADETGFTQPTGGCFAISGLTKQSRMARTWDDPGFRQSLRHPVVCLSWDEANAYAAWLSRKTGKTYRLLSEAEYEYATRAGTTAAHYWGDAISHDNGNYGAESCCNTVALDGDHWEYTSPVGSFPANPFGLYDMAGNVWVWVADCHNDDYAAVPADGTPATSGDCAQHMRRGGGWLDPPWNLRSASRFWIDDNHRSVDSGLRIARTL